MGKYQNRPKMQTKDNSHLLHKEPLKKKKPLRSTKFSHGYHKLQLLKCAHSIANSKGMLNNCRRSIENEVDNSFITNQTELLEGLHISEIDDSGHKTSKKRFKAVDNEERKSNFIIKKSNDAVHSKSELRNIDSRIEDPSDIQETNKTSRRRIDDRSPEAKKNAKKYQKRLMKHEKHIEYEKNKKVNAFFDLQHESLNSEIDFCVINRSQVLLMMSHPCSLYFFGALNLRVVYGKFEILGCTLDLQTGTVPVYSPCGTSRIRIKTIEDGAHGKLTKETLINIGLSLENVNEILTKSKNTNFAAAILEKNTSDLCSTAWPQFVEKYSGQKFLPVLKENSKLFEIENLLQCKFESEDSIKDSNFYMEHPDWEKVFDRTLKGGMHVAICGGKDSGKSTLMRYLINRSLSRFSSVLVIDCDPGQSEFVPPGCVSVVRVNSPLLGPHFTHLIQPERSVFVGEVDVNRNPHVYINSIDTLIKYCRGEEKYQNIPWIINTMGYCKGFGIPITCTVLKKIAPSLVVQLRCEDAKRNFPSLLSPLYVKKNLLRGEENISELENFHHEICEISSVSHEFQMLRKNTYEMKNYSPAVLRKIMILTYFGKLLNKNVKTVFEVTPYSCDYTKINVDILNDDSQLEDEDSRLDVINGRLVALCRKSTENDDISKYECFGYGIVRAIDRVHKRLFLTTPVGKIINNFDRLVKGSICLPESVYMQPPSTVEGRIPFLSTCIPDSLHQVVRRQFRPTKTNVLHLH
ncbi:polynucleotide 5'-hydroxyl-kinase NOL9 [Nilaparvata lugens]|uniref:polynucleotide 5'-hydroxyl-kinase NOL9 n=1 Tax=Nilaparvata lugens TaxID=108931 RepID=UPI00193CF104|nr:polynucleotide 5'-hydroxyl-kinase NOL9 [Nilaparvata lugens]XP_039277664.1 polynucleotide 5'-hydroxyl-kinase NOL9 [Nilaparvata lugens]